MLTKTTAKVLLDQTISPLLQGYKLNVVAREPISRIAYEAVFGVVFQYDEAKEDAVIEAIMNLSREKIEVTFKGQEIDDKFDIKFSAILISVEISDVE